MAPSLILKAACLGALALGAGTTASAGDWRLNPKLCPDIVKERLDERVSSARPDQPDDIDHMRQVNCPASAWTYTPSKDEKFKDGPRIYTGSSIVYVGSTLTLRRCVTSSHPLLTSSLPLTLTCA